MMLFHKLVNGSNLRRRKTNPNFQRMAKKGVAFVPVKH